jgi:outer membrane receptor protein involved in Fe transport
VQWQVLPYWKLTASYTGLTIHAWPDPDQGASPRQQSQLRSYLDLPHHVANNAAVMYVDSMNEVPAATPVRVPSYLRLDLGATWRLSDTLELAVGGQNLLRPQHVEFAGVQTPLLVEIPRTVQVRATWRF